LHDPRLDELSPYMLASNARTLMERLEPDLAPPGVLAASLGPALQQGEDYWNLFADTVERSLAALERLPVSL
jgi:hypothetical protein